MAGLNTNDIVEITMVGTLHSQIIRNVFHYRILNPASSPDYRTAMHAFTNDFDAGEASIGLAMLDMAGAQYIWEKTRGQRVWPTRDMYVESTVGLPGRQSLVAASTNIAAVVTKRGGLGNRHNIGSVHIAGVPEGKIIAGEWNPDIIGAMQAVALKMTTLYTIPLEGMDARMVIYNRKVPNVSEIVQIGEPRATVRVMRRRTVRVGE